MERQIDREKKKKRETREKENHDKRLMRNIMSFSYKIVKHEGNNDMAQPSH